ncbi:hypothetical protein ACGFMK_23615 [Amycolatopsis sp. NPDC049252]|uniref:hypothetical protein n=1 Tax=Amycolatopsis sp. NPDC049252 TaxID=3363933 RepID=UPI003716A730
MAARSAPSPGPDVVRLAMDVLAAQGLGQAAARSALAAMARDRGLPLAGCAALVVAMVDGRAR